MKIDPLKLPPVHASFPIKSIIKIFGLDDRKGHVFADFILRRILNTPASQYLGSTDDFFDEVDTLFEGSSYSEANRIVIVRMIETEICRHRGLLK